MAPRGAKAMKAHEDTALMRVVMEKVVHLHSANSQDVVAAIEGWEPAECAAMLTRLLLARYLSETGHEALPRLVLTEQGRALLKRLTPNPKPQTVDRPLVTAPFVCVSCRTSSKHYTHPVFLADSRSCTHCGGRALRVSTRFKTPRKH